MVMNVEDFDYMLPPGLIAQMPERERASSRLLVYNRRDRAIEHRHFNDLADYLRDGDLLVLNDSKVFPARLQARKETGGRIDILLVEKLRDKQWTCIVKGVKKGTSRMAVFVGDIEVLLERDEAFWVIDFPSGGDEQEIIGRYGRVPLPPYIKRRRDGNDLSDMERYQTVYADAPGSIAAPTAGFHFTHELLDRIHRMGINIVKITLHVGVGTFFPVKTRSVEAHRMHPEHYSITRDAEARIKRAKAEGRRVVACGTTTVRTLETIWANNGGAPLTGHTGLFIYPGHKFKVVDALVTNFHVPRSTPLLLVSAFAGREEVLRCYREAVERSYRFYSYGDAMLII
jgi:S-adenosylmethionine:tRNA ribosyltransferase-isomerase